jgi:hypothetical protein
MTHSESLQVAVEARGVVVPLAVKTALLMEMEVAAGQAPVAKQEVMAPFLAAEAAVEVLP